MRKSDQEAAGHTMADREGCLTAQGNGTTAMNPVNSPVLNGPPTIDEARADGDSKTSNSVNICGPPSEDVLQENGEVPTAATPNLTDHNSVPFPRDSRLWSSLPRMSKDGPIGYTQVLGYKYFTSAGDSTPQIGCRKSTLPLRDELPSPLVKESTEAFFFMPPKSEVSDRQETNKRPPRVERERIRRQNMTDGCSLLLLVPGLFLSVLSPFLLIPAYGFDNPHVNVFRYLFFVLTVLSVALNIAGGMIGNVMWYFDESDNRWRFKLHCGRGPSDHYWGAHMLKKNKSLPDGIV